MNILIFLVQKFIPMLISPPFLPPRAEHQSDDEWLDAAMQAGSPGDGAYPVSFNLGWHGGVHLTAPSVGEKTEQVRSIANGTVIFMRPAQARQNDVSHPLNYHGGWTDNGCVVILHETDIGVGPQAGDIKFFSVYMHLAEVDSRIRVGRKIYRKDSLGLAGQIYGSAQRKIHFEIVCDDENLRKLVGRNRGDLNREKNGRIDCVFGSLYFWLPPGTQIFGSNPLNGPIATKLPQTRTLQRQSMDASPNAIAHLSNKVMIVALQYNCGEGPRDDRGSAVSLTYDEAGNIAGSTLIEKGAEYDLYSKACALKRSLSPTNALPISALYEQLRFGRVINLAKENDVGSETPHWISISYSGGVGWVNLNSSGVRKFSDADFPNWCGWSIADDSADRDSRCDSEIVRAMFLGGDKSREHGSVPSKLRAAFADPFVKARLDRVICKTPSEWNTTTIDARWSWLKQSSDTQVEPLSERDYSKLRNHILALGFDSTELEGALWHWNPVMFIKHFRKCTWFSLEELVSLLPRRSGSSSSQVSEISWATAIERMRPYLLDLNMTMRKYGISTRLRQTHFLAQTYIETGLWRTMKEVGQGRQSRKRDGSLFWAAPAMEFYQAFYGRGIMQLTWPDNYNNYGMYRSMPEVATGHVYSDRRIDFNSTHYWSDPRNRNRQVIQSPKPWAPRFDPEIIATDSFNACDSGAHYWVSKKIGRETSINIVTDKGLTTSEVGRVSVLVNGGGYGFAERQAYARFIERYLFDTTDSTPSDTFSVNYRGANYNVYVDFSPQRPR